MTTDVQRIYGCKSAPEPDPRDLRLVDACAGAVVPKSRLWRHGPILDQGQTSECVAHAATAWANCLPVDDNWGEDQAHDLYRSCKIVDGEWSPASGKPVPQDGTFVRSAAKALREVGRIGKYAFGDIDAARLFVLSTGPVVQGIPWLAGMEAPDAKGRIHAAGAVMGGHGTCIIGSTGWTDADDAVIQNSWGIGWAKDGICVITWGELRKAAYGTSGFRPEFMAAAELPAQAHHDAGGE